MSQQHNDQTMVEWEICPLRVKEEILMDFIREHGADTRWDVWITFLRKRLHAMRFWNTVGMICD